MDFRSLNRRELQSLSKLNKIPANVTNIAMADALKSLETVVGIEEILNHSRSEVSGSSVEFLKEIEISSPRVPRTICRTSTRKKVRKSETKSLFANELLKTPSVSSARKKGTTTSTLDSTVKRETNVQRVYNTRRSARLTENKCADICVTQKEISQPVKIALFLEEANVNLEKSVGSGFSSVETLHESNVSFENTEDSVSEGTDEGISKAKVEDICIELEKLDVVAVDGSDHNSSVVEKVDFCDENVGLEDKHEVEEKFILNEIGSFEGKSDLADNTKQDSEVISKPCEYRDLEENMLVVNEKTDLTKAFSFPVKETVYLASEENSDSLLSDEVLLGEKVDCCGENVEVEDKHKVEEKFILNELDTFEETNGQIDNVNSNSEGILSLCENGDFEEKLMVIDENSEKVECCENFDVEEKHEVKDKFVSSEPEIFNEKSDQVDIMKSYSGGILNPCKKGDLEENLTLVDEKTNLHDALNVSLKEHNVYLASEEYSDSLLRVKVLPEADFSNANSISCEIENPIGYSGFVSDMKNGIDLNEALNVSLKEHNVYLALEVGTSIADSLSCNSENPSDLPRSVSEMNNEILDCNGSTNNNENPSGLLKLDNPVTQKETNAEPVGIEENISTNLVTIVSELLMNPNDPEPSKDVETSEEAQESLIKETAVNIMPAVYQQTGQTIADADKITHMSILDLIDHPTHLIPIYNQTLNNNSPTLTRETSQVSDNNENNAVEDEKIIIKKVEDEKLISLNESSLRQLKKQLKALSIKGNKNTNKDDMVAEARTVLKVVCENPLGH